MAIFITLTAQKRDGASSKPIGVLEGEQKQYIGETIVYGYNTKGSVTGEGWPSAPSAVGTAIAYGPNNTVVTSEVLTGSASVSTDTITFPAFDPASATSDDTTGVFKLWVPATVATNNTVYALVEVFVRDRSGVTS